MVGLNGRPRTDAARCIIVLKESCCVAHALVDYLPTVGGRVQSSVKRNSLPFFVGCSYPPADLSALKLLFQSSATTALGLTFRYQYAKPPLSMFRTKLQAPVKFPPVTCTMHSKL